MTVNEIERLLDSGFRVGFEKATGAEEYLGWILVSKMKPNARILQLIAESEAPDLIREERRRESQPYMVLNIELKRSVHETGGYETEADYRLKERFWFGTLEDVAKQFSAWGFSLEQAKEARELDAP
jgi:hypothetical protein